MIEVTGTIATLNAARYIRQLCSHWSHKLEIEERGETAAVHFPAGLMTLAAGESALQVAIKAAAGDSAARLQQVLQSHLDRFAFREAPLCYRWSDGAAPPL